MRRPDTPEEAAFRADVRAWLEAHAKRCGGADDWSLGPRDHSEAAEREYYERMRAWQRALFDGGGAAITWAPEHEGRGGTPAKQDEKPETQYRDHDRCQPPLLVFLQEIEEFPYQASAFALGSLGSKVLVVVLGIGHRMVSRPRAAACQNCLK